MKKNTVNLNRSEYSILSVSILIIGFLLAFSGCETANQDCENNRTSIDINPIAFSDLCECNIVNDKYEDKNLIIKSIDQIQQNISCSGQDCTQMDTQFNIDFDQYTLLIGKKTLTAVKGELLSQTVSKECGNKYTYRIKIKKGAYTALGNLNYGVIIPKIENDATVNFIIDIID